MIYKCPESSHLSHSIVFVDIAEPNMNQLINIAQPNMLSNTLLLKASTAIVAALFSVAAQGQGIGVGIYDSGKVTGNETIYGALKVIDVPHYPTIFRNYPSIDPKTRDDIHNGGLDPVCGSCNSTGCLCPDYSKNDNFYPELCELCRLMEGGGLRCYCSPALDSTPCNGTGPKLTGCNDHPEECKENDTTPLYFCEPQNWDQNPALKDLKAASVVYDIKTVTLLPPGLGAATTNTAQTSQPTGQALSSRAETGGASRAAVATLKGTKFGRLVVGMMAGVVAHSFSAY